MIKLTDTKSSAIAAALVTEREAHGSPAMGMVMTMVIVVDEEHAKDAMAEARHASHEHPARVLAVLRGDGRGRGQVDAEVFIGDGWTGETAVIRLTGEVTKHAESVVIPLLLPDSPVVVWWPADHPDDPADDPIGRLATRRITDAAAVTVGKSKAVQRLCHTYAPGTTDLAWTRLTPWRALLAAALDQHQLKVTGASVSSERISPSADLLAAWLADRLKVQVSRTNTEGPGITDVTLDTAEGPIEISRRDGKLATFRSPGRPDRPMALKRRTVAELLTEELRRLDEDDVYGATAKRLVADLAAPARKKPAKRAGAKKK